MPATVVWRQKTWNMQGVPHVCFSKPNGGVVVMGALRKRLSVALALKHNNSFVVQLPWVRPHQVIGQLFQFHPTQMKPPISVFDAFVGGVKIAGEVEIVGI